MKSNLNLYKKNIALLILLIFSFYVRIIAATYTGMPHYTIDSQNYIMQASVLKSGGYMGYFPNGYPLVIFLVSLFFPMEWGLLLLNVILSVFTVLLVYLIAEKLTGKFSIAILSAFIVTCYPNQFNYVHFILTEVPSTFFAVLSVYLFVKNKMGYAGIAMGLAFIMRTTLILAPVLLFIVMVKRGQKKSGLIYFLSFLAVPVLLMLYGYILTGIFTLGRNFTHNIYLTVNQPYSEWYTKVQGVKAYFNYIVLTPGQFLLERIQSLWNLWGFNPSESPGFKGYQLFRVILGLRFPILLAGIYGFIKSDKSNNYYSLLMPVVSITLIHMMFFSNPRFTVPAEPFLIILGSTGIWKLFRHDKLKP
jgi:4-amino-4-deoxy-L-arabinose transferase-like glycosyltransferase